MDNRAVGVFDSGLGGLTAVRVLRKLLPNERIVFLGDTGRMPYGSRDKDTLRMFADDDFRFLLSKDVKYILIACGTISSNIGNLHIESVPVPVTGVIEPTATAAVSASSNHRIGVIATEACIRSGAYQESVKKLDPSVEVTAVPCPKLVPLIEAFSPDRYREELFPTVSEYLEPIKQNHCDTLILGCTHYPLISDVISECLGPDVALVDSGAEAAAVTVNDLKTRNMCSSGTTIQEPAFYVTADPDRFSHSASFFLGEDISKAHLVNIQKRKNEE